MKISVYYLSNLTFEYLISILSIKRTLVHTSIINQSEKSIKDTEGSTVKSFARIE